ncbi:hypothetical protein [Paenibacillus qinlingensis]|uniref:Uncharacterized protein n=1 Tax=Paenibacillus qinlingensis TaxID=1837343 RepID=A0ABU1P147_9BACL|nr:hypothetical protein [Paenibacillus qinlingensis]MDR6553470.1 hypothetical protein [Paenibacillus qinlingensis]
MKQFFYKNRKFIAVIIGVSLIAQMFLFVVGDKALTTTNAESSQSDDNKTAADISNMTGVKIEEILKLKQSGLSWNEVLDKLKQAPNTDTQKGNRSNLLAGMELGEDAVAKLIAQGFTNEEIMEAKMLAERVQFQLKELVNDTKITPQVPVLEIKLDTKKDDKLSEFPKITEQFDVNSVLYFMLMLKKDFGSLEAVLDEYLFALQIGINLEDYIQDKDKYLKAKEEKSIGLTRDKVITMSVIESALLEKIQQNNQTAKDEFTTQGKAGSATTKDTKEKSLLPDVPLPTVKDVKPGNPAADIMKEVNVLNPNKP